MDDDMEVDIDDLFGDGAGGLLPPSRPPPKGLFQRVDELRGSGCCQSIAWSRWGSIASITSNGLDLEFRNLRIHPKDGSWDLSDPTIIPQIAPTVDGGQLKHLCWSPNGADLAAIDSAGRIAILNLAQSLNKPTFTRNSNVDPIEDLRAVVGAYWLNLSPSNLRQPGIQSVAVKTSTDYRYEISQAIAFGPCFPNAHKSALITVSTGGTLSLLWPQADGKWHELSSDIESISSSDDLITHASICADKNNTLLLAFATTAKKLSIARIAIKWGSPTANPPDRPVNPALNTVTPTIIIRLLSDTNWMDGSASDASDPFHLSPSMAALSHLSILSPSPDGPGGRPTSPTVITIRSHLPNSLSQYNQDTHSLINRWELSEASPSVHPAFEQLSARRNSVGSKPGPSPSLKKQEGFTSNKVVIWIEAICFERIICFGYSDGSVEYRDRTSLAELFTQGGLDKFSHISQIGFTYNGYEPSLVGALSPTHLSVVQKGCDGKIKWNPLVYNMGDIGTSLEDTQYAAVIAGFNMACSTAIMNSSNHDDLMAAASKFKHLPSFAFDLVSEVSKTLKFNVDYSEESHHDSLIRNPSIQLSLSIQNALGYNGDAHKRTFESKIAWISLQLRNCVVLITMAMNIRVPIPDQQKKVLGLEDSEVIRLLAGSVRWCLDLMSWLIDCLLHPEDPEVFESVTKGEDGSIPLLSGHLLATNNIALHVLLSSATRGFLTGICRRLAHLDYTARKAMSAAQSVSAPPGQSAPLISNSLRSSYTAIATLTSSSIVPISRFEAFVARIADVVKEAYTTAKFPSQQQAQGAPGDSKRNAVEQGILFGGALPEVMAPAISRIFSEELPKLRAEIDPSRLFFHDFGILGLPESNASAGKGATEGSATTSSALYRVNHTIDIFSRVPIQLGMEPEEAQGLDARGSRPGRRWRRCVRCAAAMEDIHSLTPPVQFLIMQQRRCYCGGNWDILAGARVVA
ncbi:hypothetical protein VE00_03746 [Pseudogymnoascus sp. WSF 3629]|nr:hypothetical protein VE00_03746 [Pseudogymnoascus sp. WSF 3629]